jgi:hypothetical protein
MNEVRANATHKATPIRDVCLFSDDMLKAYLTIRSIKPVAIYLYWTRAIALVYDWESRWGNPFNTLTSVCAILSGPVSDLLVSKAL